MPGKSLDPGLQNRLTNLKKPKVLGPVSGVTKAQKADQKEKSFTEKQKERNIDSEVETLRYDLSSKNILNKLSDFIYHYFGSSSNLIDLGLDEVNQKVTEEYNKFLQNNETKPEQKKILDQYTRIFSPDYRGNIIEELFTPQEYYSGNKIVANNDVVNRFLEEVYDLVSQKYQEQISGELQQGAELQQTLKKYINIGLEDNQIKWNFGRNSQGRDYFSNVKTELEQKFVDKYWDRLVKQYEGYVKNRTTNKLSDAINLPTPGSTTSDDFNTNSSPKNSTGAGSGGNKFQSRPDSGSNVGNVDSDDTDENIFDSESDSIKNNQEDSVNKKPEDELIEIIPGKGSLDPEQNDTNSADSAEAEEEKLRKEEELKKLKEQMESDRKIREEEQWKNYLGGNNATNTNFGDEESFVAFNTPDKPEEEEVKPFVVPPLDNKIKDTDNKFNFRSLPADRFAQEAHEDTHHKHQTRLEEADKLDFYNKYLQDTDKELADKAGRKANAKRQRFEKFNNSSGVDRIKRTLQTTQDNAKNKLDEATKARENGDEETAQRLERQSQNSNRISQAALNALPSEVKEQALKLLLKSVWPFLTWLVPIILIVLFFLLAIGGLISIYCRKEFETTRDGVELFMIGTNVPGALYNAATGKGFKSQLRVLLEESGICEGLNLDCNTSANTTAKAVNNDETDPGGSDSESSPGGTYCFDKVFKNKTRLTLWTANNGLKQEFTLTKQKFDEIVSAGRTAGVPDYVIAWVLSLGPTESGYDWTIWNGPKYDCWGIIQFCRSKQGGETYQGISEKILGRDIPPSELIKNKPLQMKFAYEQWKIKLKANCEYAQGKGSIYLVSYAHLGCVRPGGGDGNTKSTDYGAAAVRNSAFFECAKIAVASDIGEEKSSEKSENSLLADVNNIFSPIQAEARVGKALGNNKIPTAKIQKLESLEKSGKIDYWHEPADIALPSVEAKQGRLNIATVDLIIAIAEKYKNIQITGMNDGTSHGDYAGGHFSGLGLDIDRFTTQDGKTYTLTEATGGGSSASTQAAVQMAEFAKSSNLIRGLITYGSVQRQLTSKGWPAGSPRSPLTGGGSITTQSLANHNNHFHFYVAQDADGAGKTTPSTPTESNTNEDEVIEPVGKLNSCACTSLGTRTQLLSSSSNTDSGTVSTNTAGGTVSTGGPFTPEVRAFLDTLAKWESESDPLTLASYNSGNFVANDFDAQASTNLKPKLKSGGKAPGGGGAWNIGRYQYYTAQYSMDDINAANSGLKKAGYSFQIKDFKPTSQDYYPLGIYAGLASGSQDNLRLEKVLTKSNGLEQVIQVGNKHWASMPNSPLGQRHATMAEYKDYYNKRLQSYKSQQSNSKQAYTDDIGNQYLVDSRSTVNEDLNLLSYTNPFQSINTEARVGKALGNNKIPTAKIQKLESLEKSGKIDYWHEPADIALPSVEAKQGRLNIATVDLIIAIAEKYKNIQITGMNDGTSHGDYAGGHFSGLGLDIDRFTTQDGKTYTLTEATGGGSSASTQAAVQMAEFAKSSNLIRGLITYGSVQRQLTSKGWPAGSPRSPLTGGGSITTQSLANHNNHFHFYVAQDADGAGKTTPPTGGGNGSKTPNSTNISSLCKCADNNQTQLVSTGGSNFGGGSSGGAGAGTTVGSYDTKAFTRDDKKITVGSEQIANMKKYQPTVEKYAKQFGLDPNMMMAQILQESAFRTDLINGSVRSSAGATGMTQFMPDTIATVNHPTTGKPLSLNDITRNPELAIYAQAVYLKRLYKLKVTKANTTLVLAAYNAGPGNVEKYGGVPPFSETRHYVKDIAANTKVFAGTSTKSSSIGSNELDTNFADNSSINSATNNFFENLTDLAGPISTEAATSGIFPGANTKYLVRNRGDLANGNTKKAVILHYTAMGQSNSSYTVDDMAAEFRRRAEAQKGEAYVHFTTGRNGEIYQTLPDHYRGAGALGRIYKNNSSYTVNSNTIQVEMHYDASTKGEKPTTAMLESTAKIAAKYSSDPTLLYVHWGVQPWNRSDIDWINPDGKIESNLIKFISLVRKNGAWNSGPWMSKGSDANINLEIAKIITKNNIENALKNYADPATLKDKTPDGQTSKATLNKGLKEVSNTTLPVESGGDRSTPDKAVECQEISDKAADQSDNTNTPDPNVPSSAKFVTPTSGVYTDYYAKPHPTRGRNHNGVDIANAIGTPIYAAADGEIMYAKFDSETGNEIRLKHAEGYQTRYLHLSQFVVKSGTVKKGQLIGKMGSTGRSTGPHLHFELTKNGSYHGNTPPCSILKCPTLRGNFKALEAK